METGAAKSEVARLGQLFNEISAAAAAVPADVAPIDFAKYNATIKSPGIVGKFQSEYSSLNLPAFLGTESVNASNAKFASLVSEASGAVAASTARAAELQAMIDEMTAKRLTKFTTVGDVLDQHPEIGEEVEEEIAAMDWKH